MSEHISGRPTTLGEKQGVHLRRGPEVAKADKRDGLVWPQAALDEFESAKDTLVKQLRSQVKLLARARGSRIATDVEVRDVLRQIVVGGRQTALIRVCRILSVSAVLAGGVALNRGWESGDSLLVALGVGFGVILTAFQELLLYYKR